MIRPPRRPPLFPYTTLFRSARTGAKVPISLADSSPDRLSYCRVCDGSRAELVNPLAEAEQGSDGRHRPISGATVAVGIDRFRHGFVSERVIDESGHLGDDRGPIGADKLD